MSSAIVRRNSRSAGNRSLARANTFATLVNTTNLLRRALRNYNVRRGLERGVRRAQRFARQARERIQQRNRTQVRGPIGSRRFYKIKGMARGPTHSTTRMIVRRTPRRQKFLRKLFKTNPVKTMYVHRYGFAWMGATATAKTIWYSCTNLKFNNLHDYMKGRIFAPDQATAQSSAIAGSNGQIGNYPDAYIYIGKCTYQYEIYNPTNYNITVFIYDLICKRDTPYSITYNDANNEFNSAPEACMMKSTKPQYENNLATNPDFVIADPTFEQGNTYWNSIGMKPTDYHYFNTFWKVKGVRKIVLAPGEMHHHRVVFNPKSRLTNAALYMPRQNIDPDDSKLGISGLTVATLFGFQGQTAVENDQSADNTNSVSTLPGKIAVTLVRKENIWSGSLTAQRIIQTTNLKDTMDAPKIFTDLIEQPASSV